jgi:hypothetical protein
VQQTPSVPTVPDSAQQAVVSPLVAHCVPLAQQTSPDCPEQIWLSSQQVPSSTTICPDGQHAETLPSELDVHIVPLAQQKLVVPSGF